MNTNEQVTGHKHRPLKGPQKKSGLTLLVASILAVLIYFFYPLLLGAVGVLLIRDEQDKLQSAPYIVLLMGDYTPSRANAALSLWHRQVAPQIVFMTEKADGFVAEGLAPDLSEIHRRYFEKQGLPPANILEIKDCHTNSTLDEAICLLKTLRASPQKPSNIVVVTSWYHTSRAGWIFDHILGLDGIKVQTVAALVNSESKPGELLDPKLWWQQKGQVLAVLSEYIKWTYWSIRGLPNSV